MCFNPRYPERHDQHLSCVSENRVFILSCFISARCCYCPGSQVPRTPFPRSRERQAVARLRAGSSAVSAATCLSTSVGISWSPRCFRERRFPPSSPPFAIFSETKRELGYNKTTEPGKSCNINIKLGSIFFFFFLRCLDWIFRERDRSGEKHVLAGLWFGRPHTTV